MSPVEELEYVEERGPGILELPESSEQPPAAEGPPEAQLYPGWELEHIEQFLKGTGAGIHFMIGAAENDWRMTEEDLERMAPPLTRIANRWQPALRLSPIADPALFAHGAFLYAWRSMLERKRALYDAERQEPEPGAAYERAAAPAAAPAGAESNGAAAPDSDEEPRTYFSQGGEDDEQ
jgi:hypothetical protein